MDSTPKPNTDSDIPLHADTQAMLDCLREAVAEAIERKRRLGQYWVVWTPEGIRFEGENAPKQE